MTDEPPLVTARNVTHEYGTVTVLDDVSLDVPHGAVTALIGPNGAGKTSLLRILARVIEPSSGTVRYTDTGTVRPIGYLPQRPSFRPGFTVRETLSFYASLVGADEEVAMTHLERVGLASAADRRVEALSGGMTRLVGIAQATIGEPPVVVLDEPASGLDPGMSAHVFDVATDLATRGTAVVVSSHNLALVERTANTIALLDDCRLVRAGPTTSFLEREGDTLLDAFHDSITADRGVVHVQGEEVG